MALATCGGDRMKYIVTITEVLEKEVIVEAESEHDAFSIANDNYYNAEDDYVLSASDYVDTSFSVKKAE